MKHVFILAILLLVTLAAAPVANACTVCMGDDQSNVAGAANGAIFVMLGVLVVMLSSFAGFVFYLARREKQPVPDHIHLTQSA